MVCDDDAVAEVAGLNPGLASLRTSVGRHHSGSLTNPATPVLWKMTKLMLFGRGFNREVGKFHTSDNSGLLFISIPTFINGIFTLRLSSISWNSCYCQKTANVLRIELRSTLYFTCVIEHWDMTINLQDHGEVWQEKVFSRLATQSCNPDQGTWRPRIELRVSARGCRALLVRWKMYICYFMSDCVSVCSDQTNRSIWIVFRLWRLLTSICSLMRSCSLPESEPLMFPFWGWRSNGMRRRN